MDEQNITLYSSEWRIMECLWTESPHTVTQLMHALKAETGWSKSTINTMVSRMEQKGLIYYKDGRKAREYYPAITRDEVARSETESLLSRVYRGSVGMMMNALVEKKPLSKEELDELYTILQKAEEAQKK